VSSYPLVIPPGLLTDRPNSFRYWFVKISTVIALFSLLRSMRVPLRSSPIVRSQRRPSHLTCMHFFPQSALNFAWFPRPPGWRFLSLLTRFQNPWSFPPDTWTFAEDINICLSQAPRRDRLLTDPCFPRRSHLNSKLPLRRTSRFSPLQAVRWPGSSFFRRCSPKPPRPSSSFEYKFLPNAQAFPPRIVFFKLDDVGFSQSFTRTFDPASPLSFRSRRPPFFYSRRFFRTKFHWRLLSEAF